MTAKERAAAAELRLAQLIRAIESHRSYLWGKGPIAHEADAILYAAANLKDVRREKE